MKNKLMKNKKNNQMVNNDIFGSMKFEAKLSRLLVKGM